MDLSADDSTYFFNLKSWGKEKYFLSHKDFSFMSTLQVLRTLSKNVVKINVFILPIVNAKCYRQIWKTEKYFNFEKFRPFSIVQKVSSLP